MALSSEPCARIDPRPARLKTPETIGMFRLFADLIAKHLDADRKLAATESALIEERAVSTGEDRFDDRDVFYLVSVDLCHRSLVSYKMSPKRGWDSRTR